MRLVLKSVVVTSLALGVAFVAMLSPTSSKADVLPLNWHDAMPFRIPHVSNPDQIAKLAVDLRPEIIKRGLHIREQGERGTCTVFATTFLIEYQKAGEPGVAPGLKLSEEYLNWAANQVNGTPYFDGGFFTKMIPGFEKYGLCKSKYMPYKSTFDPNEQASAKAQANAQKLFPSPYAFTTVKVWDNTKGMTSSEVDHVESLLRRGIPVASGMWWQTANTAFVTVHGVPLLKYYPRSADTGSNPPMADGHTIDLVGYCKSKEFPGGGYFVFRNSWGTSFGDKGYGFVSFQYIKTYANDGIAIVPPPTVTAPHILKGHLITY